MSNDNNNGGGVSTVLSLITAILVFLSIFCYNKWQKTKQKYNDEKDKAELLSESISNLSDTAKVYKLKLSDSASVMAARINELTVSRNNIKSVLYGKEQELKGAKVNKRNIKSSASVASVVHDSVIVPVYLDTLRNLYTEYKDSFMTIKATIFRDHTANIKYTDYEDFDLIEKRAPTKRFLFFKWKYRNTYILVPHNPKVWVKKLKVFSFTSR